MSSIDITPSPRVLRMLGQIDFAPWQCLCELIDNAIDAFIDARSAGRAIAEPEITIDLPKLRDLRGDSAVLRVADNGNGMTQEQLEKAVKAGYSGNDPIEKMGLFGMGFNISTARLGRRTEIWTTTRDQDHWISVTIDFDELERVSSFEAPIQEVAKNSQELKEEVHGTIIKISRLEPERLNPLVVGAGKGKSKEILGRIYGKVMEDHGITILYDASQIKPAKHCVWSRKRYVETKQFGRVPAIIDIDQSFDAQRFCGTCWVWLDPSESVCEACGSADSIVERERRIEGWIGIQRYFDKEHYGFDLIRNGRVIEQLDKSLFFFNADTGETLEEYPIDATHWGGRIVGELEINFVRVSHQKDSFDKLDPEWKRVVHTIRGSSPLQPRIAQRMGLEKNESPLARLFTGYRKATAGLNSLVPGTADGRGLNSGSVREYVEKFKQGVEGYQSDEKWYDLVLQAEKGNKTDNQEGDESIGGKFPIDEEGSANVDEREEVESTEDTPKRKNVTKRKDPSLSGEYQLEELLGKPRVTVEAFSIEDPNDQRAYFWEPDGYRFLFYYNEKSELFKNSLDEPLDYLLVDLAHHFISISSASARENPVSEIVRLLRRKYFAEHEPDLNQLEERAASFVKELKLFLADVLKSSPNFSSDQLPSGAIESTIQNIVRQQNISKSEASDWIRQGDFLEFAPHKVLLDVLHEWPNLVSDGRYFSFSLEASPTENEELINELVSALRDVVWFVEDAMGALRRGSIWRCRCARAAASLKLLEHWQA